jgi:LPS sulfotransferase NodH
LRAVLEDASVRKIVLKRRNRVKSFVSLELARHTGEWVLYHESPRPGPRPRIAINPTSLLEMVLYNEAYYNEIESALTATGQEGLELYYERLCSEQASTLGAILAFLALSGGSVAGMRGQSWKLTPLSLSETIANFEEVGAALKGTPLEAELYSTAF